MTACYDNCASYIKNNQMLRRIKEKVVCCGFWIYRVSQKFGTKLTLFVNEVRWIKKVRVNLYPKMLYRRVVSVRKFVLIVCLVFVINVGNFSLLQECSFEIYRIFLLS